MRNRMIVRTGIVTCIIIAGVILLCRLLWIDKDFVKDRVILCFHGVDEIELKYKEENNIFLNESREVLVDYNNMTQTILFINKQNEFVEKNITSGKINKLNKFDIEEKVSNLQYGPVSNEISYIKDGCIYIYDRLEKKEKKITNCISANWRNTYVWKDTNTLYTINTVTDSEPKRLFVNNTEYKKTPINNTDTINCFTINSKGNKIYAVLEKSNFNGITIETTYRLIEIDLINTTSRELTNIDTEVNLILKCINDKYLIYVEEHLYEKNSKVICYNIESGKKKCIYNTADKIIGIIVK